MSTQDETGGGAEAAVGLPLHDDFRLRDPVTALADAVRTSAYHYDEATRAVYVLRAEDVEELIEDPRLTSERPKDRRLASLPDAYRPTQERLKRFTSQWPIFLDGARHAPVRKQLLLGLQHTVTPAVAARIAARVSDLLAGRADQTFDWIAEFARPLSALGVGDVVGVDEGEAAHLVHHASAILHEMATPLMDHERAVAALAAADELQSWLADRLAEPGSPLLAGLARLWTDEQAGPLTATAALTQVVTGALDPVVSLLGVLAQRVTPKLLATVDHAVLREELIRLAAPFRFLPRYARCPMDLGGHQVAEDGRVVLGLATANLDPRKWSSPLEVADRDRTAHHAFGQGDHYCAGATYTRAVVRSVLDHMVREEVVFQVADVEHEAELTSLRFRRMTGRLVRY